MYDDKMKLTQEVDPNVPEFFGKLVFGTIPSDPVVSKAASHLPLVIDDAPQARGTRAYIELCMEVLDRE